MEPINIPINGVLDLHTFKPGEVGELLDDYISACMEKGISALRIVHGKGKGILKKRVCAHLERHPAVAAFTDAPMDAGGWGATLVTLKKTVPDQ